DLLEAGLRENPVFTANIKYPEHSDEEPIREFETTSSFLDHFLIPFRQRAAVAELEVTESEIAEKILELVKEVQLAWLVVKLFEQILTNEYERVEIKDL